MVRQMIVYDYNGRRVKVRRSEKKMDSNLSEDMVLPPIDKKPSAYTPRTPRDKLSPILAPQPPLSNLEDNVNGNDNGEALSPSNTTVNNLTSTSRNSDVGKSSYDDKTIPIVAKDGEQTGVLTKSLLSRRVNGEVIYFPRLTKKPSSIRTSRSEPTSFDYSNRKYVYDRLYGYVGIDSNDVLDLRSSQSNLRRPPRQEKVVTFYRNFESTTPELRLVISENRFRDIHELIDDLSKILNLREREKYIHTPNGKILRSLDEFTNGGVYFFGPPYIYNVGDYYRFREANTPDLIDDVSPQPQPQPPREKPMVYRRLSRVSPTFEDYNKYGITPHVGDRHRRLIHIITNIDSSKTFSLTIDTYRHRTLNRILQDVNDMVQPENGRINYLCTRKGRMVQSVGELFWAADEYFVGIISSVENQNASKYLLMDEYNTNEAESPRAKVQPAPAPAPVPLIDDYLKTVQISVNGLVHRFDPPTPVHPDFPNLQKPESTVDVTIKLDWVYGYNGRSSRANVFVLPTDELIYPVSTVVVLYKQETHQQRQYKEHSDEIRCLAQHPNSWTFASGQASGGDESDLSHVRVWDSKSLLTLSVLDFDMIQFSVECLAFSKADDGTNLASVYTDGTYWRVGIWNWSKGALTNKSEPYDAEEVSCAYHPQENVVFTCGAEHVYAWNEINNSLDKAEGHFYDYEVPEFVTCIVFNAEGQMITADSNGYIHLWDEEKFYTSSIIKTSHESSISSMLDLPNGQLITGGASDHLLTCVDPKQIIPTVKQVQLPEEVGEVTALTTIKSGVVGNDFESLNLVMGTDRNCILTGTMKTSFAKVVSGPSSQIKAVAAHPTGAAFLSAGYDQTVTLWNSESRSELWSAPVDYECSAATFHPSGELVLIGTTRGRWMVIRTDDSTHVSSFQCDEDGITAISFSADSSMLAVGTSSGTIFLYFVYDHGKSYRFLETIRSYLNAIVAIDWSITAHHLRLMTSKFELEIWNVEKKSQEIRRHVVRDILWTSHDCLLSYQTSGIWSNSEPGLQFLSGNKSSAGDLFCVSGEDGLVRLFNYPCDMEAAPYNEINFHKCPVSQVQFLAGGSTLMTAGLTDFCIAQWSLTNKDEPGNTTTRSNRHRVMYYVENKEVPKKQMETPRNQSRMSHVNGIANSNHNGSYLNNNNNNKKDTIAALLPRDGKPLRTRRMSHPDNVRVIKREYVDAHDYMVRKDLGMNSREMAQARTTDYVMNNRPYMVVSREMDQRKRLSGRTTVLAKSLPNLNDI